MTIDRVAFARVMGGFADRIGRPLAPETADMYLDVLSEALTTEEFLAGARIVFRTHRFNTWPAPEQFVEAVKPQSAPELAAAEIFERVLAIAANAYRPYSERLAEITALSAVAARAYHAAGGRRDFETVLEADVPWLRKRFVERYEEAMDEAAKRHQAHVALAAVEPTVHALITDTANRLGMPDSRRAVRQIPARP